MKFTASEKTLIFSDHNAKNNAETSQDKVMAKIVALWKQKNTSSWN